ncbi:MAG: hypothetical protein EBU90_27595 [Proteobacteria bacterium]|nr:hypothetical protein [Pseudomonadota bacterium]
MKNLYILEAKWNDKKGRVRKNLIVGVYDSLTRLEQEKDKILQEHHTFASVTFGVNTEIQPFHA